MNKMMAAAGGNAGAGPAQHWPRGFSLLELVVGLAVSAIIVTAATGTVLTLRRTQNEATIGGQLDRDARVVIDMLERDTSFLGAGVPPGDCIRFPGTGTDPGCTGLDLLPVIRRATPTSLVFIGDQPYPNSEFNGTMMAVFGGNVDPARPFEDDHVVVTSEVSGNCVPFVSGAGATFQCSTRQTTLIPGDYSGDTDCRQGQTNARTCPWGMGKLQTGVRAHLAVVQADGDWLRRAWDGQFGTDSDPYLSLQYAGNPNATDVVSTSLRRLSFVSQPDRVFYSFEGAGGGACTTPPCRVMRRQCWGALSGPDAAGFPVEGTAPITSATDPAFCDPANGEGTGWEELVSNVKEFSLSYAQSASTTLPATVPVTELDNIRLVQLDMTLTATVPGGAFPIERRVRQQFFLLNREQDAP